MTKRVAYDERRFTVFSRERTRNVPAGRYDVLSEAVSHAETVTYDMYVFDRIQWEVVHRNWEKGESNE